MPEDRTQPPSNRRRQLAREQGQVAHSPELTSAAGCLAAVIVLGTMGDDLLLGLIKLVGYSLTERPLASVDPAAVVEVLRSMFLGLAWPLVVILAAFATGAFAAHQAQVCGLCTPHRIVPELSRLWSLSRGPGFAGQIERTGLTLVKSIVLVIATAWTIRDWLDIQRASGLDGAALADAAGGLVLHVARMLAALLLVFGVIDYALRYRRFEMMLRTTPQQQRDDRRMIEGDVVARAQRRQIARTWRGDSPDLLIGATLVLAGPGGLTVILAGGPPPRRITVRATAKGNQGARLRRSAELLTLAQVESPNLARRLAQVSAARSAITADLIADLAAIWPPS